MAAKRFTLMLSWVAAARVHSYWTNWQNLGISGRNTSLTIKTLNGKFTSNSTVVEGLKVAGVSEDNSEWLPLLRTFSRPDLPVDNGDIIKPSQRRK